MSNREFLTIPELAKLLGVSRITVYKRVKEGKIPASRIGRTYVIQDQVVIDILGKKLTARGKRRIDSAVRKVVSEYGEVLKRLGRE